MSTLKVSVTSLGPTSAMTILLSRTKRKNAFNSRMYLDIVDALKQAEANDDIAVVILSGDGGMCTNRS